VDRVVIVGAGRLVREGSMAELRAATGGAVLVRSPESRRLAEVLRREGRAVELEGDDGMTVTGTTAAEVGHAAHTAGIELHELRGMGSGLEEIYFELTSGQEQYAAAAPQGGAG
jgi:ABC-2 type transport system ATP-binding protein